MLVSLLFFKQETSLLLMSGVVNTMQSKYSANSFRRRKARNISLEMGVDHIYPQLCPNADNTNSAVHVLFQLGPESTQLQALNALLAQITKIPCFYQLRTVEQLGYIVFSGSRQLNGIQYFYITVQSNHATPEYLEQRIELFVSSLRDLIVDLSEDAFQVLNIFFYLYTIYTFINLNFFRNMLPQSPEI